MGRGGWQVRLFEVPFTVVVFREPGRVRVVLADCESFHKGIVTDGRPDTPDARQLPAKSSTLGDMTDSLDPWLPGDKRR